MKTSGVIFIILLILSACSTNNEQKTDYELKVDFNEQSKTNGLVRVLTTENIKVHSYVNPQLIQVTSYVIELEDSLVLVDAQLTYTFTKEVIEYAESLSKPIARVIITHAHPDHILGAYAYKNHRVFALEESIQVIKENGEAMRQVYLQNFGEADAAPEILVPQDTLHIGDFLVNGVKFSVSQKEDNEADVMTLIEIPKAKILITGDFIYNQVHLFPGNNKLSSWSKQLSELDKSIKAKIILPGHGYPTDNKVIKENIDYLNKAMEVVAIDGMNAVTYKEAMVTAFPEYQGSLLMDFGANALFLNN